MVGFSTIGYHSSRSGKFARIWSSCKFARPPTFALVFRRFLRLTFAYPANWAIQVADNSIYLSSPDRAGFEADSELAYFVFIGERANPERRPFSELVTEGLSEELRQAFRFTSVRIGDYSTYQTESLPSRAGALEVFFEDGDRYVDFGLAPYDSQNPIIGQDRHAKLFEALLKTVRLIK